VSNELRLPLRPLDAQMVQILAGAVGAGLVRQRIQEKLRAAEQLAAVGQAIGYIIHDLRGPLGNARQLVNMLHTGDTKTLTRDEQFDYINESVAISLELLNDSLEFCRGQVHVAPIRGRVCELLRKHLELLRLDLAEIPVELKLEIPAGLEGALDPARMARVLRNLAKNAGEALAGRPSAVVEIGARCVPQGIEIWVADNGPGLPESLREKLFQPFATHGKRGGTGFGLAISKQLVEAHRGRIHVSSGPSGTRFSITLPLDIAPAVAKAPRRMSTLGDADTSTILSASDSSSRERKRVLLAEDGAVNQKLIAGLLRNGGHEATIAADGRAALAAWEQGGFDLVLLDLEMPIMSGLEVAAAIRAKEARGRKRTPLVALTAHQTAEAKEACDRVAMDGYLEKPVRPEELLRLIDELCPVAASR
jgi:CheY-like chemotaxis protein/nitrogen-specific signal transduction histidine kinase